MTMTNVEHIRTQLIAGVTAADGSKTFDDQAAIRELDRIVYIEPGNSEARDLLNKLRVLAYNGFYQQRKAIIDKGYSGLNLQLIGMRERFLRGSFATEEDMWGGFETFWSDVVDTFNRTNGVFAESSPELDRTRYSAQALRE